MILRAAVLAFSLAAGKSSLPLSQPKVISHIDITKVHKFTNSH